MAMSTSIATTEMNSAINLSGDDSPDLSRPVSWPESEIGRQWVWQLHRHPSRTRRSGSFCAPVECDAAVFDVDFAQRLRIPRPAAPSIDPLSDRTGSLTTEPWLRADSTA
jgi:hypothetical protein